MRVIRLLNGETISENLRDAIRDATPDSMDYQETFIKAHAERREEKIGYRPVQVGGEAIPVFLSVVFIKGIDSSGDYFYVVNNLNGTEYVVANECEAKEAVLKDLRKFLSEQIK